MKSKFFIIVFLIFVISACGSTPTSLPVSTSMSIPTETTIPTSTNIPIVTLAKFGAERMEIGTHGNMACVTYQGDTNDLTGLIISGVFQQDNHDVERNVKSEVINDKMCFEMADFLYMPKSPVEIVLNIKASTDKQIELSEDSKKRTYNLGEYEVVPCFTWIFGENGMDVKVGGGFRDGHRQWDLSFSSENYPQSVGTPLIAPSDGYVVNFTDTVPGRSGTITNLQTYLPQLGLIFNVGHINPTNHLKVDEHFRAGDIIAIIDSKQPSTTFPHTHLGVNTTEIPPHGSPWGAADENNWMNPFSADPFSLGASLPSGLWLPESLPQEVFELFKQNYFKTNTFAEYVPLLSK